MSSPLTLLEKGEMSERYAVVRDRGRQHRVAEGDVIYIDLRDDLKTGDEIEFKEVLFVRDGEKVHVGRPLVEGARVVARVLKPEVKDRKIRVFRYKKKKRWHRTLGHRQRYTEARIEKIVVE